MKRRAIKAVFRRWAAQQRVDIVDYCPVPWPDEHSQLLARVRAVLRVSDALADAMRNGAVVTFAMVGDYRDRVAALYEALATVSVGVEFYWYTDDGVVMYHLQDFVFRRYGDEYDGGHDGVSFEALQVRAVMYSEYAAECAEQLQS